MSHTADAVETAPHDRGDDTMKAITRQRYGGPDVFELATVAIPEPRSDEVLVEVHAAGVNRGDALEMRGWPYIARVVGYGARRPRRPVPGYDLAGRVVAVGDAVSDVRMGDEVLGWAASGALAEYATVATTSLVPKPEPLTFEEAAALPTAGVAALQAIRMADAVAAGEEVLVVGASGGVGTFAVQIAAAYGAEVTGVASGRNTDLVAGIGASEVIDYTRQDFTRNEGRYEMIVDLVGNRPLRTVRRALTDAGTLVVVGGRNPRSVTGMARFATAAAMSPLVSQRMVPLFSRPDRSDLADLVELVETGQVRPVIDRSFDLSTGADAVAHVETGRSRGRVVISV